MFNLGDFAKEKISGFYGIVTAKAEYLDGTISIQVTKVGLIDGKPFNEWFNQNQLISTNRLGE